MTCITHGREMDYSTATSYSSEWYSYPCLQGHLSCTQNHLSYLPTSVSQENNPSMSAEEKGRGGAGPWFLRPLCQWCQAWLIDRLVGRWVSCRFGSISHFDGENLFIPSAKDWKGDPERRVKSLAGTDIGVSSILHYITYSLFTVAWCNIIVVGVRVVTLGL